MSKKHSKYRTIRGFAESVREAAAFLERNPSRWIKHDLVRTNDKGVRCFCALGAIGNVQSRGKHAFPTYPENISVFKAAQSCAFGGLTVSGFNDNVAKSTQEVASRLRKFARALEHGGRNA